MPPSSRVPATSRSVYVIDRYTHRRLLPGQIGDLSEVFNLDALIHMLVLSLIVFILGWCVVSITTKCAYELSRRTGALERELHQQEVQLRAISMIQEPEQ